jgi:hypothetical protein
VLHPSSRIWLEGSVRFSIWLDWFRKIGHLAKTVAGQPAPHPQKKKENKKITNQKLSQALSSISP